MMDRREFAALVGSSAATALVGGCKSATQDARSTAVRTGPGGERLGRIIRPNEKMNIACVGCGGKGGSDINGVSSENIVALCDVDWKRAQGSFRKYPGAARYRDFRHMLLEMDGQIDAVTVSTPDHMHFPAAMMAITMGKHVFVQKPLTHTVEEARKLTLAARRHQVATIMGNQGHANEGTRLLREWVEADAIGPVHEVHIWTNRPVWPQGLRRPVLTEPVPETLDWNRWLGVAPTRPYNSCYAPFTWRGWWDFGCGALGDMGCHMMDAAFWALDLGQPVRIEAESGPVNNETAPEWAIVTYQFPARGDKPPVKLVWYEGGRKPPRPDDLEAERDLPRVGQLLIGEKGTIMDSSDYCRSPRLIPETAMRAFDRPPRTIPRIPGGNHYKEWINACKGGTPAGSNFDHAGPLTEMVLLGNLAIRTGRPVEWDATTMTCTNDPEANAFVSKRYRRF